VIRKILLRNFMSHRETVLEPAEGVTLLLGPNNCGKSAIVEALKVLSANEGKDWFIRHSAPETSIQLEITEADGKKHSIQWTKKVGTGGWYEIDGTRYERLNRTVPDDLKEILRLQSVGEIHPHFGEQKHSLFLIDEKAPEVARFFSAGTDISLLMGMQAELSSEKRSARQDKTRITTERDRFQNHERILEPLPELEIRLQEADRAHRELENALEKQKQVRQTVPQLLEAMDELEQLSRSGETLKSLQTPPTPHDTRELRRVAETHRTLAREIALTQKRTTPLSDLKNLPELHATESLQKVARDIPRGTRAVEVSTRRQRALQALEPEPHLKDSGPLRSVLSQFAASLKDQKQLTSRIGCLTQLESVPSEIDTSPLRLALSTFTQVNADIRKLLSTQTELAQEETAIQMQLREAIARNPQCPLCGGPLTAEHLLEVQHA
jgi:energy-coupling factor transporter ATP-binding protein EcfA2